MRTLTAFCVVVALAAPAVAQPTITQADLLRRTIDLQRLLAPPPAGERPAFFTPAERKAGADGWDVLAEIEGPGAVTRLWVGDPRGQLRLLLDGEMALETTFDGLLSGQLAPFVGPLVTDGRNLCFPIGFERTCRVEARDGPTAYQITAVRFAPGTTVARFQSPLDEAARRALAEVKATLEEGLSDKQLFGGQRMMPVAVAEEIGPGEVLRETLSKAGIVRVLYVALTDRSDPRDLYALHRCILRIYVDGEKTPSVEAPLADFFGSGFDVVPFNSLAMGTDKALTVPLPDRPRGQDRFMYCLWPMPYRDGLRVEIENRNASKRKIGLLLHLRVDTRPPPADALRFHARYRREDPYQGEDYVLLDAGGPGRLVGCVLSVDCPRREWWGAGAVRVWIDGAPRPSPVGFGADGYVGDIGGWQEQAGPLYGVTRRGPYGKSSAYRWHIADDIPFQKSIRLAVENTQARFKDTYFGSVAYWYAQPGAAHAFESLREDDLDVPGLRIPGAVEIEDRVLGSDWGNAVKEKHAGGAELSGGQAASITTDQPVRVIIPSDAARRVLLKLRVNPERPFETIRVVDAEGRPIGTVEYARAEDGIYSVGELELKAGDNVVTVQCSRRAMLDCWILEPPPGSDR